jgi:fatty acid desaturase
MVGNFLAGIAMLVEDEYGAGDVVDVGPAGATRRFQTAAPICATHWPQRRLPMADQATQAGTYERHDRQWLRFFVVGLLLWVATVAVTFWTGNVNLVPTVILLGSFLVPVTFVVYAFQRHADQVVTAQRIFAAFVYGGCSGCLAHRSWRRPSSSSRRRPPTSASG